MLIFPLFAVLVWYGCFRYRRSLRGLAALVLGLAGITVLAWFDITLARLFGSSFGPSLFMLLLIGEGSIIAMVGVFLLAQPRERAQLPCRACGYELLGLELANPRCPECGLAHAVAEVVADQPVCAANAPLAPVEEELPIAAAA